MLIDAPAKTGLQKVADRTTPLLRNYWYVVALSSQIDRTLRERWVLEETIVLFRQEDGTPVALQNRCAHRSFPLAKSKLIGDTIACAYHGITYDAGGKCIGVPCQESVPSNLAVKRYPLVERAPFVWIWMGDPANARADAIPAELDFFADPQWSTAVHGYFAPKCNYLALHENLLDLTHFPFLHGDKAGSVEYAKAPFEVESSGDRVRITRVMRAGQLARARAMGMGIDPEHRVNQTSETHFVSPALNVGHSIIEDAQALPGGRSVFRAEIVHAMTPASATETHYFWVSARDFGVGNTMIDEAARKRSNETFLEDVDALGWIEEILARERRPEFHEVSVRGDKAGLKMRAIVARLARSEGRSTR